MASSGTTSTKTRFTGAQLIVHLLERQGITTVAGIPGGTVLPLYDALSQSTQIRHVLARHEQGAGFIAQGMARTQGKPAVCMACSGPGATNLVTAIADARLDSIPLICITGQVPSSMIGTDAFQEVDTYGISIPITKHNYLVRDISELPQVISDAFRIAHALSAEFRRRGTLARLRQHVDLNFCGLDILRNVYPHRTRAARLGNAKRIADHLRQLADIAN